MRESRPMNQKQMQSLSQSGTFQKLFSVTNPVTRDRLIGNGVERLAPTACDGENG